MMAVSGMSTSRLNHSIARPRPSPASGVSVLRGRAVRRRRGGRPVDASPGMSAGGPRRAEVMSSLAELPGLLLHPGHEPEGLAVLAVGEDLLGGGRPAA